MKSSPIFPKFLVALALLCAGPVFGQPTNQEKIKGSWNLDKFESEVIRPDGEKIKNELDGIIIGFNKGVITIAKRDSKTDQFYKSGPYSLDGNKLVFGEDRADILLLDDKQLKIKTSQGILYFSKI